MSMSSPESTAPRTLPFSPPAPLVRALVRLRRWLLAISRRLIPPQFVMLELVSQRWISHALAAFVELGLAEALADGPRSTPDLAQSLGLAPGPLGRLLFALHSEDLISCDEAGRFGLNHYSRVLALSDPDCIAHTVLEAACARNTQLWTRLGPTVRSGERAWDKVFEEPEIWDYLSSRPEEAQVFYRAMAEMSWHTAVGYAAAVDLTDASSVVEVAGGTGQLLSVILRTHPTLRGILYELPDVEAEATALLAREGVGDRAEFLPGDLTQGLPPGHDVYVICNILHGFTDEELAALLVRWRACVSEQARLVIIDPIRPERADLSHPAYIDLQMLLESRGGRARSRAEFEAVLGQAGFTIHRVSPTLNPFNLAILARPTPGASR